MAGQTSWGIEVGAGGLKAVKLARDGEGVQVLDYVNEPHKKPLSAPEINAEEMMRLALGTLVAQHDLAGSTIAISVPGSQAFARFAKLPPVEAKNLLNVVKFEAVQQIPFPIDEVQWDYQTFQAPDSPEVEVGIFAIRTESVMETLHKWQDAGKTPDILTLSPLAVYNAVAWDEQFSEKTPGTVILDVGTSSTDLIVAERGGMWIRTFPIGGHQFTEALVTAFNLSYMKAEKLKGEAEKSEHARHILQALRPVFGDLAQDVQRSISYYTSTHKDAKLTRLVCVGSTFALPGLRKFLSQQLSLDVVRLEKFARVTKVAGGKEADFQSHAGEMATAMGLALQGLGNQAIDANLVPATVVKEAMWKDKTKWFVTAAAIALAAGIAALLKPLVFDASAMGVVKPAIIDDVSREASALKQKWTSAEAEYQPDPKAAGLLQVTAARDVVPKVIDDVQTMLASAEKTVGVVPGDKQGALEFVDFATQYVGPGGAIDPATNQPVAATPGDRGTIKASLRININRAASNADLFIQKELQGWLTANAKRWPNYEIKNARWVFEKTDKVDDKGDVQPGERAPVGTPGLGGRNERPPMSMPTPPSGGKRGAALGGGAAPPPMMPERPTGPRPPLGGGGGGGPMPGVEDVEKAAPLPKWKGALTEPGTTITTYVVTWDAVLKGEEVKP